jgi:hypothetical protein
MLAEPWLVSSRAGRAGALLLLAATLLWPSSSPRAAPTDPIAHDPTMIRQGRSYYVFITGDSGVANTYLPMKRSRDLIHWEELGPVFTAPPRWVVDTLGITPADFWAPDITYFNGKYHLYYAASQFGVNNSVIGLATNRTLDPASSDYAWVDEGMVLRSQPGDDFNAIDPDVFLDEAGQAWLASGSFWVGIQLRRLDSATGKLAAGATAVPLVDRHWPPNAVEGGSIVHHGDAYYLFASFDYCCRGVDSDYRVVVGRAPSVDGPYYDQTGLPLLQGGGTEVLRGYNEFAGPGGGDVFADGDDTWFVHHYYDREDGGRPKLSVRPVSWRDGWPVLGDPLSGSDQVGHGNAYFRVIERTSAKLVSTPPDGPQAPLCGYEGANIELTAEAGSPCQQWRLDHAGGGFYSLLNRHSNKVFDVAFCGFFDGANIDQWGWLDNDCQKFRFLPADAGWTRLQNANQPGGQPGKLVEAAAPCGPADGANVQLWDPDAGRCQQFRLEPAGEVLIASADGRSVLGVVDCRAHGGWSVVEERRTSSECQLWRFAPTDEGYYRIVNAGSGKEIGVAGARCSGTSLVVREAWATEPECRQWRLELLDDGTFRLVNRGTEQVIEAPGCGGRGPQVRRAAWDGSTCQRFRLALP